MKPRHQRMLAVGLAIAGITIAAGLTLKAFDENMMFFIDISDVVAGNYPQERNFRIGGLVVENSIEREEGSLDMRFRVTDMQCELNVTYNGVLPDLFREGQGVVAHGAIVAGEVFVADKILAKHDENYMAPEVAASLAKHADEKLTPLQKDGVECNSG
ncbi:MAG: cytochrome c maturation protein CcmE [Woeseiaceae bacterium]|nr:cytochrome c maturation protein CcmE [Woeseiaceae bacterium]